MNACTRNPVTTIGRRRPRLVVALSFCLVAAASGLRAETAADPLAAGDALWRQARFEEAAASYRAVWEADSLQLEAHRRYQDAMRRAGQGAVAEALYGERAAAEGSAVNLYLQARVTADARDAAKILKKAIGLAPTFWRARACLASVLAESDKARDALKEADRAVEAAPEESEPLRVRGRILEMLERSGDARADFEQAIALAPGNADAHACLAFARLSAGEADAAIESFEKSLELDPVALAPLCALAQLEHTKHLEDRRGGGDDGGGAPREEGAGSTSGAAATSPGVSRMRAALKLMPGEAELHYVLGVLLSDDPNARAEAETELLAAIEKSPEDVDYLSAAADLYLDMQKPSKACEMAQAAVKADRKSVEAYRALGRSYVGLDDFDKAAGALGMAAKIAPADPELAFLLGDCLDHAGEFKEAIAAFERAAKLDPADPEPHVRVGVIYEVERSDKKSALASYRKYVELGGDDPRVKEWIAELEK